MPKATFKVLSKKPVPNQNLSYHIFKTECGWIGFLASDYGVIRVTLPKHSMNEVLNEICPERLGARNCPERFQELENKFIAYFQGKMISFREQYLDTSGVSLFSQAIWQACQMIPSGETRSYAWVAKKANYPEAPRAVGQSLARNQFPIIVPCHRVVSSDGKLHGFGGKSNLFELKRRLLALEGVFI